MTSQTRQKINTIYMLPNISRSKSKQATKYGQLIVPWLLEYSIRNIFLEHSSVECGREASTSPFCEKTNLRISQDQ